MVLLLSTLHRNTMCLCREHTIRTHCIQSVSATVLLCAHCLAMEIYNYSPGSSRNGIDQGELADVRPAHKDKASSRSAALG